LLVRQRCAAGGADAFAAGTGTASPGAHAAASAALPATSAAAGTSASTLSASHNRTSLAVASLLFHRNRFKGTHFDAYSAAGAEIFIDLGIFTHCYGPGAALRLTCPAAAANIFINLRLQINSPFSK